MWRRKKGAAMLDLNIIPCISSEHKHIWNCHKDCQWCHRSMDDIELEASRLRIKELEDSIFVYKKIISNYTGGIFNVFS